MNDYNQKRVADRGPYRIPDIPRNITDLGTGQIAVTSIPQQISFVSVKRVGTKLTNLGATEIFYGNSSSVSSLSGDLLPAGRGQWVSIPAMSVIFVVCAPGQTGAISWAEAYE